MPATARRSGGLARGIAVALAIAGSAACGPKDPAAAPDAQQAVIADGVGVDVVALDFDGLLKLLRSDGARATVVNCWATWCAPCVAELPDLLAAAASYRDRSVRVVLVSYDLAMGNSGGLDRVAGVAKVKRFLEQRKLAPAAGVQVVLYDDDVSKLDERFDLPGPIPTTVVLDREGKVVGREKGATTLAGFEALFASAVQ